MARSQQTEAKAVSEPRRLKQPSYKRGKFSKRIKHPGPKLSGSWSLLKRSFSVLMRNRRVFLGVLAVYAILSLILVKGLAGTGNLSDTKTAIESQASISSFDKSLTLLGSLFSSSGSNNSVAAMYQTILFILVSLTVIWILRQVYGEKTIKKIKVKLAFYQSTTPLIPFILVLLVILVQLIPFIIGSGLYSFISSNGLAVSAVEKIIWGLAFFLLALWSLYMITASIFALYIVTLPGTMPRQALRSARRLVQYRRWTVMRKIVFLPVTLFFVVSFLMLPILLWLTPVAEPIFFIVSLLTLIVVHSYIYELYRELI